MNGRSFAAFFILFTIATGLYIDQAFDWGQTATNVWAWSLYFALIVADPKHARISLVFCLAYASMGEYLMSDLWGLYDYREGHIPLFVPPGHALLYFLGVTIADKVPKQIVYAVPALLAPYLAYAIWTLVDTEALVWFTVFLAFLKWGPNKQLYTTMFVLALIMEIYGTSLGNWTWRPQVPHTFLTSTNPPATAGVFYCILDVMVIASTNFFRQRFVLKKQVAAT